MPLKQSVIDAFATLGLDTDAEYAIASRSYKKLALQHHPDKKHNDPNATQRFQQISMAWDTCSKHYENPRSSEQSSGRFGGYDDDDDDMDDMEEEAMHDFFEFMFERMFSSGGYHRRDRRQWNQGHRHGGHSHSHGPSFSFGTGFDMPSHLFNHHHPYEDDYYTPHPPPDPAAQRRAREAQARADDERRRREKKEREDHIRQVRAFEEEVKREEAEEKRQAQEAFKAQDRITQFRVTAFKAGRSGDGALLRRLVEEHDMDVTLPEKLKAKPGKGKKAKSGGGDEPFETMLHAAARGCDEETMKFLISKGADASSLTQDSLSPFHISLLYSNAPAVRFFLSLKPTPENCHPSRACADGRTPLRLALEGKGSQDKVVEVLKLVVKDATVHVVEKCWNESLSEGVKEVLQSKKGFLPPSAPGSGAGTPTTSSAPLSKKAQKKLEKQRAADEKAARIADEKARADAKRKVKEAKARAREEEARNKREEEEAIRLVEESIRQEKEEEERQRMEVERAARAKVEAARAKVEVEEKARQDERLRIEMEAETERKRVEELKRREEDVKRKEAELARKEKALKKKQAEAEARAQEEVRERERKEREAVAAAARAKEEAQQAREELERQRQSSASSQKASLETARQRKAQEARAKHMAEEAARREAKEAEEQRQILMMQEQNLRQVAFEETRAEAQPQVCKHWQRGICRFGTHCRYMHAVPPTVYYAETPEDLQPPSPPRTPVTTTPACRFFSKGNCKYGSRCRNAHVDAAVTPKPAAPRTTAPLAANGPSTKTPPAPSTKAATPKSPSEAPTPTEEQLKRRAEQSAKDKARHQAAVAKRQLAAAEGAQQSSTSKSSGTTSITSKPKATTQGSKPTQTQGSMPTPSPTPSPSYWEGMSPPMTPEDVQTMVIPDSLFARQVPDKDGGVRDVADRKSVV